MKRIPYETSLTDERRSCYVSNPSSKTTVGIIHVVFQMESHVRDECAMTEVSCPYQQAGCTFQVSSEMIQRLHLFTVQLINNHKGQRQTCKNTKLIIYVVDTKRGKMCLALIDCESDLSFQS